MSYIVVFAYKFPTYVTIIIGQKSNKFPLMMLTFQMQSIKFTEKK